MLNEKLQAIYLDWFNNYLTIEKFAEHKGLTVSQAKTLIELSKECHEDIVKFYQSMKDVG